MNIFKTNSYSYIKNLLTLIVILIFKVNIAFSQLITYETFTQLERNDQIEVVKMVQEFVAQNEKLQLEYIEKEFSQKRYSEFLNNLNVFLNHAYADNKATIIDPDTGDKNPVCLYGGWISIMPLDKKGNPKGYCTHPNKVVKKPSLLDSAKENVQAYETRMTQEYKGYLDGTHVKDKTPKPKKFIQIIRRPEKKGKSIISYKESDTCAQEGMILCAPSIFGTAKNGAIFCATGNNSSYNTSYLCSVGIAKTSDSQEILNNLVEQILSGDDTKKKEFNYMMMTMYDTCMCKGLTGMMNKTYAEKMFGHRTCFAWMYQSQRILERLNESQLCQDKFKDYNYSEVASITDWFKTAQETIKEQLLPYQSKDSQNEYFNLTKKDDEEFKKKREEALTKYKEQNICPLMIKPKIKLSLGNSLGADWYEVIATLEGVSKSAESVTGWTFSLQVSGKGEIKEYKIVGDNFYQAKKIQTDYTITATVNNLGPATLLIPKKTDEPSITIKLGARDEINKIQKVDATVTGVDGKSYKIKWPVGEASNSIEFKAEIKDKSYKVKAQLLVDNKTIDSNEVEILPITETATCNIELKDDSKDNEEIYKLNLNGIEEGSIKEIKWVDTSKLKSPINYKDTTVKLSIPSDVFNLSATVVLNNNQEISCEGLEVPTIPNRRNKFQDYKISIKKINTTESEEEFEASVTLGGNPTSLNGLTINWFVYDVVEDTSQASEKSELEKAREQRESEEGSATQTSTSNKTKAGTGKKTKIARKKNDQKVFATLTGEKVKPNTKSNELVVDKLKKKKPKPKIDDTTPFQTPPVPRPNRPRSGTIFQGIK